MDIFHTCKTYQWFIGIVRWLGLKNNMAVGILFDSVQIYASLRPSLLVSVCEVCYRKMQDIYLLPNKPSQVASAAFPDYLAVFRMTRSSRLAITKISIVSKMNDEREYQC